MVRRKRAVPLGPGLSLLALAAIAALGLGLRLWRLGAQSLWHDEAQTLLIAGLPFGEIVQRAYRPPLYHLFLHLWRAVAPNAEFWLRLPSALWGAAVAPLVYAAAVRLYDRRTGFLAAALATLSPTLLRYAQELRMYSLMALEFAILLYLAAKILFPREPLTRSWWRRWRAWLAFGLAEVAGLYTHYFAIPFVAWLAALVGLFLFLARRRRVLQAWLGLQTAALLTYVPWLLIIRGGRGGTEDYVAAEVLPVVTTVPGVREALLQIWQFYTLGHLSATASASAGAGLLRILSWTGAVALGLGVLLLALRAIASTCRAGANTWWNTWRQPAPRELNGSTPERLSDSFLLALVAVPFLTAVVMAQLRPGVVHPRHLMMIASPLLILIARVSTWAFTAARRTRPARLADLVSILGRVLGAVAWVSFVGLFLSGVPLAYRSATSERPNVRSLVQEVEAVTAAGDMVIFPYIDYAFDYYFKGEAQTFHLETRVGDVALAEWFLPRAQGARRAALLRWVDAYADPRDFLPWLLQNNGRLRSRGWVAQRLLSVYDLSSPLTLPGLVPARVRLDPLLLVGMHIQPTVPADQALAVALQWSASEAPAADYKASLKVLDPDGQRVAIDDRVLLSEQSSAPSSRWRVGTSARNYYLIDLPVGTPPIDYTVALSVYEGKRELDVFNEAGAPAGTTHILGSFRVRPPATFPMDYPASTAMTRVQAAAAPGLLLVGYRVDRASLVPGQALAVTLYWKATTSPLPLYPVQVHLRSAAGQVLAGQSGQPAYGQYPFDRWRQGELVADRRVLRVAPTTQPGQASLELVVGEGNTSLSLGQIRLDESDRRFVFPAIQYPLDVTFGHVARLRGYSLAKSTVGSGEPVRLTLYWQALNDEPLPVSYDVFAHLLGPQNQMLAQHDGSPAAGAWPTTLWLKDQAIVDLHELAFRDTIYQGQGVLEVGLYDPRTYARLRTSEGGDRFLLPVKITVQR